MSASRWPWWASWQPADGFLALTRVRVSGRDPEAIENDALTIIEIDAKERIAAVVVFDLDDFEAAIPELDARYLAGEAAALRRHVVGHRTGLRHLQPARRDPATTPDWVNIDHRRAVAFAPGELIDYVHAAWELGQDVSIYVEAVHRLNSLGAVITHATRATSRRASMPSGGWYFW